MLLSGSDRSGRTKHDPRARLLRPPSAAPTDVPEIPAFDPWARARMSVSFMRPRSPKPNCRLPCSVRFRAAMRCWHGWTAAPWVCRGLVLHLQHLHMRDLTCFWKTFSSNRPTAGAGIGLALLRQIGQRAMAESCRRSNGVCLTGTSPRSTSTAVSARSRWQGWHTRQLGATRSPPWRKEPPMADQAFDLIVLAAARAAMSAPSVRRSSA